METYKKRKEMFLETLKKEFETSWTNLSEKEIEFALFWFELWYFYNDNNNE